MSEPFVIFVRADEISDDIINDEEFLRDVMYHVWSEKVLDAGGVAVSGKAELEIKSMNAMPGFPGAVAGIRAVGQARRNK